MKVGAQEAKTHLPRLLDEVTPGRRVTITRHGVPIARRVPFDSGNCADLSHAVAELRSFSKGIRLEAPSLRQLIERGRR